jgi:hypothetical protein
MIAQFMTSTIRRKAITAFIVWQNMDANSNQVQDVRDGGTNHQWSSGYSHLISVSGEPVTLFSFKFSIMFSFL